MSSVMLRNRSIFLVLFVGIQLTLGQNTYGYIRGEAGVPTAINPSDPGSTRTAVASAAVVPGSPTPYGYSSRSPASSFSSGATYPSRPSSDSSFGSSFSPSSSGILTGRANPTRPAAIFPGSSSSIIPGSPYSDETSQSLYDSIPGEPGIDYPIFATTPLTSFNCNQQQYPGYYSDIEARCQAFHICALNRTYSFLCPNGTVFSQETLVCVWWNQFNCGLAQSLYANNAFLFDLYDNKPVPTSFPGSNINLGRGQSASSSGRPPSGPVFNSQSRPTVPNSFTSGAYGGISGQQIGFPNTQEPKNFPTAAGPTPTAGFPSPSVGLPTSFGTTIRPTFPALPADASFGTTSLPSATTKRDYLPPRLS